MKELSLAELKHELSEAGGQELVQLLEDMVANVRSVDDIYFFFDKTFADLRISTSSLQFSAGQGSPVAG